MAVDQTPNYSSLSAFPGSRDYSETKEMGDERLQVLCGSYQKRRCELVHFLREGENVTLLEAANEIQKKQRSPQIQVNDEGVQLALAWARKELTLGAVQGAIGATHGGTSTYGFLARALAEHVRRGG